MTNGKNQDISENKPSSLIDGETSRRITSLRYILSVLVVFIHNNFTAEKLADSLAEGNRIPIFEQNTLGEWIQFMISSGLGCCAVPVSGFGDTVLLNHNLKDIGILFISGQCI